MLDRPRMSPLNAVDSNAAQCLLARDQADPGLVWGQSRQHHRAEVEHEVILHCKAHQDIIEAVAVVLKDERARLGIEMK